MSIRCIQHQALYLQVLNLLNTHKTLDLKQVLPASVQAYQQTLTSLQALHIPIQRKGNIYWLEQPQACLDASQIYAHLNNHSHQQLQNLHVFASLKSSNDFLLKKKPAHLQACLADHQSQGRGQRGKQWQAGFADSLCLSLAYHYPTPLPAGLSLVLAIDIVQQLQQLNFPNIQIKWPNDLFWQGKKLAGILVDMRHSQTACDIVVGLGLNWQTPTQKDHFDYPVCDLSMINPKTSFDHNHIAAKLLDTLVQTLINFPSQGLKNKAQAWNSLDLLLGKRIKVQQADKTITGVAAGINKQGALKVQLAEGSLIAIQQGSVRLS